MLHHIRQNNSWIANANGHVIDEKFFREFKRAGADYALLSHDQFLKYFNEEYKKNGSPFKYTIDGMPVMVGDNLPKGEVDFYVGKGILGKIVNLWFPPEVKDAKE